MQQFKQSMIQAFKANYSYPENYIEIINDPDTLWEGIEENLKPNGPTLLIYFGVDCVCFEGTPETKPAYYETCFKDPDLEFTFNGQKILVTIDN